MIIICAFCDFKISKYIEIIKKKTCQKIILFSRSEEKKEVKNGNLLGDFAGSSVQSNLFFKAFIYEHV